MKNRIHRRYAKRSVSDDASKPSNAFSYNNYSASLKLNDAVFWSSRSTNLPNDFWSGFEWQSSWNSFKKIAVYQNYKDDIEVVGSVHESVDELEDIQTRFR